MKEPDSQPNKRKLNPEKEDKGNAKTKGGKGERLR